MEGGNFAKAARIIKETRPHLILIQEIRDSAACLTLIDSMKIFDYFLLTCSSYRDNAGIPLFQQVAIIARIKPILSACKQWQSLGVVEPPRGFAYSDRKNDEQ